MALLFSVVGVSATLALDQYEKIAMNAPVVVSVSQKSVGQASPFFQEV